MRWLALLGIAALSAACGGGDKPNLEFSPDMAYSVPYDTFAPNPVTPDGKTLMKPPEGSIPRGYTPLHYDTDYDEAVRAGQELKNPYTSTPEVVARGKKEFQTFCTPCHGQQGKGDGLVVQRGFPQPPSLVAEHARSIPDGQIFHVITYGLMGIMPAHGPQIVPDDRWKIIRYVRELQAEAPAPAPTPGGTP